MRILKWLSKKYLSIIIVFLLSSFYTLAEDKPIDIWNIEKNSNETKSLTTSSTENSEIKEENNIYNLQADNKKEIVQLDKQLTSKDIKIVGLYDPADYGLSIDMWSNSDGLTLKKLFKNINDYDLSSDASEILNISSGLKFVELHNALKSFSK